MSETVYASSDPAVLAEFAKWQDQHQDWKDRAFELTAEFDPDRPRRIVVGNGHWYGLEYRQEWGIPYGWTFRDGDGGAPYLRPDARTKVGREARNMMRAHTPPRDIRYRLPGLVGEVEIGNRWFQCGMVEIAGTVYVSFDCDPTESDRRKWEAGPQWRPVKLSEYHLALESQEPEVEACAGVSR